MPPPADGPDDVAPRPQADPVELVLSYHRRTGHRPERSAPAPGFLDWDNQPNPFRRFAGAPLTRLPLPAAGGAQPSATPRGADGRSRSAHVDPPAAEGNRGASLAPRADYAELFQPGVLPAAALDLHTLSCFLFHSLALSAWKSIPGARWALRVNPSSGNLHPTEGWLLLPTLPGLHDGAALWHYAPAEHGLERRACLDPSDFAGLSELLPPGGFAVLLSSVPWREAWKYGERAFRYCQHDVGHALGALRLSAALLGWQVRALPRLGHATLASLLGFDREDASHPGEPEHPDLLCVVEPAQQAPHDDPGFLERQEAALARCARSARFAGSANQLSPQHHPWEAIDLVESACRPPSIREREPARDEFAGAATGGTHRQDAGEQAPAASRPPTPATPRTTKGSAPCTPPEPVPGLLPPTGLSAATLIRQRRSAVSMDGVTNLSRERFESLLFRLVPSPGRCPFDTLPGTARVHPLLFVHRVRDLSPGLYALVRQPGAEDLLRQHTHPGFTWEHPRSTPPELPLFRLATGDVRSLAARLACGQAIASDGVFALAMLADLGAALDEWGAPAYQRLHWEAGLIGQLLYLEAEAAGLRGTGIGCFFDDATHTALQLTDPRWRSLYHFTVGGPLEDERLQSEPAYPG